MKARSRALMILRRITGVIAIWNLKRGLRSIDKDLEFQLVSRGRGYSLKHLALKGSVIKYFAKTETAIDRVMRRNPSGRHRVGIRREAEVIARLHEKGMAPRVVFRDKASYATTFIAGGTLGARVRDLVDEQPRLAMDMILASLDVVTRAQDLDLYHDGNPENILIDGKKPLLIDAEISMDTNEYPAVRRLLETLCQDHRKLHALLMKEMPEILESMPSTTDDVPGYRELLRRRSAATVRMET